MSEVKTSTAQDVVRCLLGTFMVGAGTGHLSFARYGFHAQVPDWVPQDKDAVVLESGVVEIAAGLSLLFATPIKRELGIGLAGFYAAVFPGNIHQYRRHIAALNMNTDRKRFIRLFFQPVLIGAALWSTGFFNKKK
ncbi:MAG: hypothetical protein EOO59_00255 [Hymenobacter sp.]|nr:MAG: hypothetical protein EOO59_00255 [Hymenobacter sp.]